MSDTSQVTMDAGQTDATAPPKSGNERRALPWVTLCTVIACIVVHVGIINEDQPLTWESYKKWGALPDAEIWEGAYEGLISGVFVHVDFWHLATNLYWLWVLGLLLERAIKPLAFFVFLVTAAFVSSAWQMALSDEGSIGMSGVVYALFGYMWPTRHRYPEFKQALSPNVVSIFIVWLVACVVITYMDIYPIGNAAHISGMLFGGAVAGYFCLQYRPKLMLTALSVMFLFAVIILAWCPWSRTWLAVKAYGHHEHQNYEKALDYYSRLIRIDPENAWAYGNRGLVQDALGDPEKAHADYAKANELDPDMANLE